MEGTGSPLIVVEASSHFRHVHAHADRRQGCRDPTGRLLPRLGLSRGGKVEQCGGIGGKGGDQAGSFGR